MREISVPVQAEKRGKIQRAYARKCRTYSVFFYGFLALAVAGFLGAVIVALVYELKENVSDALFGILLGSFLGGGALTGALSYLFSRLLTGCDRARLDFSERCDSDRSFYVGEGTLATFEEDHLLLHGDKGDTKKIRIPYAEIRLFSVCTRRAPKEKGEWSVVLELPARYLAKSGKAEAGETILVQTDAKERLYTAIRERGLTLLGEDRSPKENHRYVLKTKYYVPISDKRKRALVMMIVGFLAAAAGIPVAFWNVTVGSFLAVIGMFFGLRSLSAFLGAKSVFSVYEEGIFWKEAGGERIFLKWEEVGSITREAVENVPVLKVRCIYGAYHLPDIAGAYEYLKDFRPDACK